ncbi:hypothetical protein OXX79_004535 [Metschnikowia pulcherrima]
MVLLASNESCPRANNSSSLLDSLLEETQFYDKVKSNSSLCGDALQMPSTSHSELRKGPHKIKPKKKMSNKFGGFKRKLITVPRWLKHKPNPKSKAGTDKVEAHRNSKPISPSNEFSFRKEPCGQNTDEDRKSTRIIRTANSLATSISLPQERPRKTPNIKLPKGFQKALSVRSFIRQFVFASTNKSLLHALWAHGYIGKAKSSRGLTAPSSVFSGTNQKKHILSFLQFVKRKTGQIAHTLHGVWTFITSLASTSTTPKSELRQTYAPLTEDESKNSSIQLSGRENIESVLEIQVSLVPANVVIEVDGFFGFSPATPQPFDYMDDINNAGNNALLEDSSKTVTTESSETESPFGPAIVSTVDQRLSMARNTHVTEIENTPHFGEKVTFEAIINNPIPDCSTTCEVQGVPEIDLVDDTGDTVFAASDWVDVATELAAHAPDAEVSVCALPMREISALLPQVTRVESRDSTESNFAPAASAVELAESAKIAANVAAAIGSHISSKSVSGRTSPESGPIVIEASEISEDESEESNTHENLSDVSGFSEEDSVEPVISLKAANLCAVPPENEPKSDGCETRDVANSEEVTVSNIRDSSDSSPGTRTETVFRCTFKSVFSPISEDVDGEATEPEIDALVPEVFTQNSCSAPQSAHEQFEDSKLSIELAKILGNFEDKAWASSCENSIVSTSRILPSVESAEPSPRLINEKSESRADSEKAHTLPERPLSDPVVPAKIVFYTYNPCTKTNKAWADYDSDSDDSIYENFFASHGKVYPPNKNVSAQSSKKKSKIHSSHEAHETSAIATPEHTQVGEKNISDSSNSSLEDCVGKNGCGWKKISLDQLFASAKPMDSSESSDLSSDKTDKVTEENCWKKLSLGDVPWNVSPKSAKNAENEASKSSKADTSVMEANDPDFVDNQQVSGTHADVIIDSIRNSAQNEDLTDIPDKELTEHTAAKRQSMEADSGVPAYQNSAPEADSSPEKGPFPQSIPTGSVDNDEASAQIPDTENFETSVINQAQLGEYYPQYSAPGPLSILEIAFAHIDEINTPAIAHVLKTTMVRYRQDFIHLIENVLLPCNDKIRRLMGEILSAKKQLGLLITSESGIRAEIGQLDTLLRATVLGKDPALSTRMSICDSVITDLCLTFDNFKADLDTLQSGFDTRIEQIVNSISTIRENSNELGSKYDIFYRLNNAQGHFGSLDIHSCTLVNEFSMRASWHYFVDLNDFKAFLAGDVAALGQSRDMLGVTLLSTQHCFSKLNARKIPSKSVLPTSTPVHKPSLDSFSPAAKEAVVENSLAPIENPEMEIEKKRTRGKRPEKRYRRPAGKKRGPRGRGSTDKRTEKTAAKDAPYARRRMNIKT